MPIFLGSRIRIPTPVIGDDDHEEMQGGLTVGSSSSIVINWLPMEIGFAAGLIGRLFSLIPGRSGYPGWPSGYISQLALAIIAALIGASVVTSLVSKQFTATTFLALAATQFRDVRQTERQTLEKEEALTLVARGAGYIEGIAKTYEARNYLALLVALFTSAATALGGLIPGIIAGIVFVILGEIFMAGGKVGDVMDVRPGKIRWEKSSLLYVDKVMMMEVGLPHARDHWSREGVGIVLTPKNRQGQALLWNVAQRQAITHEAAMAVGVQKDVGYPDLGPLTRLNMPAATGEAALAIIPVSHDMERLIKAIRATPTLESVKFQRFRSPVLKHKEMDD